MGPPTVIFHPVVPSPTSELRRVTPHPAENVKLQMPMGIGVLLAELKVQFYHMLRMNLQLLHAQLQGTGRALYMYSSPPKNFANNSTTIESCYIKFYTLLNFT